MDEFHGDPLEWICKDLFAKVLSLLDAASLARSVSVSRKWKFVAESHRTWENHCLKLWKDKCIVRTRSLHEIKSSIRAYCLSLEEGRRCYGTVIADKNHDRWSVLILVEFLVQNGSGELLGELWSILARASSDEEILPQGRLCLCRSRWPTVGRSRMPLEFHKDACPSSTWKAWREVLNYGLCTNKPVASFESLTYFMLGMENGKLHGCLRDIASQWKLSSMSDCWWQLNKILISMTGLNKLWRRTVIFILYFIWYLWWF